ncbi:MAG: hypothetical protein LBH43_01660 [Treponema sp.]|jgi:hypothetical protein|nr:hypothetical protein [Treponema sp.]
MFQLNLFKRKTAEKALELASWMRVEMGDLRLQLKAVQAALSKQEKAMNRLEGMLADLKQRELFEE